MSTVIASDLQQSAGDHRLAASRGEWLGLAAVVLIALVARLPGLDTALWYDEIITVVDFARLPLVKLVATFDSLNNHMLYSILAHLCIATFGEHAWSVRLPALIFGLASIVVAWLMARRALARWPALLVALLLALSVNHIWFSQNARGYTMLLFFTSASLLAFVDGLERPRWSIWTIFAVCAAAAIYTHMSAGFFYVALAIVTLLVWLRARRNGGAFPWLQVFYGGGLALMLALLLYWPIIAKAGRTVKTASHDIATSGHALAEWQNPLRAFQEIGNSLSGTTPLVPLLLAIAGIVLVVGAIRLAQRQPVLLLTYVIHIPLTLLLLRLLSFRIWPRYFFTEISFIFVLIVLGTVVIVDWITRKAIPRADPRLARGLPVAAAAAMVGISLLLLRRDYSMPKQDFIGARDWVEHRVTAGDKVGATGLAAVAYDRYYRPGWHAANSLDELHALRLAAARTWILVAFPHQTLGARADVMAEIQHDFDRVAIFPGSLGDGAIWVFRSRTRHG